MKSIREIGEKIKGVPEFVRNRDTVLIFIMILSVSAAFGLGRLSALEFGKGEVTFKSPEESNVSVNFAAAGAAPAAAPKSASPASNTEGGGIVVGSKNGTKYHYPWCSGAKSISEQNKITFESIEAARAAGYTPAANCKGLK